MRRVRKGNFFRKTTKFAHPQPGGSTKRGGGGEGEASERSFLGNEIAGCAAELEGRRWCRTPRPYKRCAHKLTSHSPSGGMERLMRSSGRGRCRRGRRRRWIGGSPGCPGGVGRGGGGKYSAATSRRSANVSDQTLPFLAATGSLSATPSAAASRASSSGMSPETVHMDVSVNNPVTILRLV